MGGKNAKPVDTMRVAVFPCWIYNTRTPPPTSSDVATERGETQKVVQKANLTDNEIE